MKKKYIFIIMLALATFSCKESFLELTPLDQYSAATFFKTELQFRQAIAGAYVPLRNVLNNDYYLCEMRSDNTHYQSYGSVFGMDLIFRENIANFEDTPLNSYSNNEYFQCYSIISKANVVIERLKNVEIASAAKYDIDGQAKFLRAWSYFKLVRLFGDVPLSLTEVTKAEEAFLPRTSADLIYKQIIADATDAITELSPPTKFPQTGVATKGAATMLLAEVYMTNKKYAEAEILLATLPAMGYTLNANYADAFLTTNKNSKESIFEVQYLEGTAAGTAPSNFIYQFLPRTKSTILITGTATNNTGPGGWNTPTQDMIKAYEPNDKRLDASIGMAEGTYDASFYFIVSANKSVINYTPAAGKQGVPYAKKYLHTPHAAVNNSNDNWPIYRYADALLLLAEAQNEQGKSPLTSLNLVRVRAGLAPSAETNQSLLREIIAHERRVELAFENHRWHDLVRTGKAIEVMTAYGVKMKQLYSYLSPQSYNVTSSRLLYPIPQSERDLNTDLTQNQGY